MTADAAELWGDSDYDAIVPHWTAIYDELVESLEPRAGDHWLDVATGTGEIALRAARAGAIVTAQDLAPRMIERARAKADATGAQIDFDVGDCTAMPYADAAFDVVASSFGLIHVPDRQGVAAEVKRVLRPGGRLGFTAWHELPKLTELYALFGRDYSDAPWADAGELERLLSDAFELEVQERVWHVRGESGEAILQCWERAAPPTKAYLESLDGETRAQVRTALVEHWESYRSDDGIDEPRGYLLVLGHRR